jgi:glycosyltransferase involved in cell wall biosynthesis
MKKNCNIGVVTFPISEAGNFSLFNLAKVLYSLSGKIYLISDIQGQDPFENDANIVSFYRVTHKSQKKLLLRELSYFYTQLKIVFIMLRLTKNVDLWVFFHGGDGLIIPIAIAKLLRKKVVLISAASGLRMAQASNDPLQRYFSISQNITYGLANQIVLYSTRLIYENNLQKYRSKIIIAAQHYIDLGVFKIIKPFCERDNLVGYIGRFSEEKGIVEFVKAIPRTLIKDNEIDFIIGETEN